MTDKPEEFEHLDEKHPKLDLKNLDKGLIRFCLECGQMNPNVKSTLPKRDPADYKWLRMVYDSIEDDAKHMARLLTDIAHYIARSEEEKDAKVQDSVIETLEELNDLVENIENANDLITLGGVSPLLDLLRDCSRPRVCAASCGVVSAIMANNPRGQNSLFEAGAMAFIFAALETFQKLSSSCDHDDDYIQAEARALSAVSSLIRELPKAQKEFVDKGGMTILHTALSHSSPLLRMRAVSALWRFSSTEDNVSLLVKEGFIAQLLDLLFSEDPSNNESLRELIADIMAKSSVFQVAKNVILPRKNDIVYLAVAIKKRDPSGALAEFLHNLVTNL